MKGNEIIGRTMTPNGFMPNCLQQVDADSVKAPLYMLRFTGTMRETPQVKPYACLLSYSSIALKNRADLKAGNSPH